MEVVETNSENLLKDFKVTVPATDIEERINLRLDEVGKGASIPGFRPGKAPVSVLRQRFGPSIRGEILETTLRDSTETLLSERGLRPASQPKIDITSYEEGNDLEYSLSVELMPDIGDVDFTSIKLNRYKVIASENEITDTLDNLAKQNRTSEALNTKRAAKNGDIVLIDFVGKIDNEEFEGGTGNDIELELGAEQFIPGFEKQLIGAKPGESKTVNVTFPENYGGSKLSGKEAVFDCSVKELRKAIIPKIDDAFASKLGMDSLDSLKQAIREQIETEYSQFSREKVKRELLDELSEKYDFEVPPRTLESEFEQVWNQVEEARKNDKLDPEDVGKSDEDLRDQYKKISERRVRLGLLLNHVGESNELSVTQEEMNKAIMDHARQMPGQEQKVVEFYRENAEAQNSLRGPIFEDKVVNFIIEMADVTEKEITPEALRAEIEDEEKKPILEESSKGKEKKKSSTKRKASSVEKKSGGAKSEKSDKPKKSTKKGKK
tara:strand:- start:8093 stop:9571 length:1479 start_codon:yes stop_codon:yes gene_type:complete